MSNFGPWQGRLPADWVSSGIDTAFVFDPGGGYTIYRGSALVALFTSETGVQPQRYIAATYSGWPGTWLPQLKHAPSGRGGNLWAVTTDGDVLYHNGTQLQGAAFGLLTTPAQLGQELPDMTGMVAYPELLVDQLRDAFQGPEIGSIAPCQGPLQEQGRQPPLLHRGETRGTTRCRPGPQSV